VLNLAAADSMAGVAGTATAVTYSIFGMEYALPNETYKKLAQGQARNKCGGGLYCPWLHHCVGLRKYV
jgi:hypothetical protein